MLVKDFYLSVHRKGGEVSVYEISDEDLAADPQYFGYLNEAGSWIIQRRNAGDGTYRYKYGSSDYTTAWTNRASLIYGLYNELFIAP